MKSRKVNVLTRQIFLNNVSSNFNECKLLSVIARQNCKFDIDSNNYKTFYNYIKEDRFVNSHDSVNSNWFGNIQQLNFSKMNGVIFAVYFSDGIAFYKLHNNDIDDLYNIRKSQHYKGERQFIISNKNIMLLNKYKLAFLKYEDVFDW